MKKIKLEMSLTVTIQDGYDEFRRYCVTRNYSKYTVKHYDNTIHVFELFYPLDNKIDTIDEELIGKFTRYLLKKELAGKTIATYIGSLRTILYFFMKKEYLKPFHIIKPRYDKPIKEVYTDVELRLLLKRPHIKQCGFAEYRNWVMANYFIATGQRKNTVLNLKIGDLDFENGIVTLRVVKNRKPTILPITPSLIEILKEYLKYRKGEGDNYLFCNDKGEQMTSSSIGCAINCYNRSRGVNRTSVHAFRHTFAKKYLLGGGNVFMLQKLMMHADLNTTKEYLNLFVEDLQKDYELYNPLEQLINKNKKIIMEKEK
ncbi:MAG TPA: tyrosine-type recombinase/integrase [Anaerovoracaceae bacterium]|nr:tyrosine-type recombinase/integrase [Anaerovoracaceae bacterium]